MDKRKKIALDVDGVLLDFMTMFDYAAEQFLQRKIIPAKDQHERDEYHLSKRVGCTKEEAHQILQYMLDTGLYGKIPALPGVYQAIQEIKKQNFKIYIVTALPEEARAMRLKNLKEVLDLVPDEIHLVGMGKSKKAALEKIMPDIFIDDRIDYLASVPNLYHTAWCDRFETQSDMETMVDVHVYSLSDWVKDHMPRVVKKLDRFYLENTPIQREIKLIDFKSKVSALKPY